MNQPAAARNFQSVFWNIAYFDKPYFEGMFSEFVFPDLTSPTWDSVNWLQKRFMKWFNRERLKTFLTFPVETMNLLNDGKEYVDLSSGIGVNSLGHGNEKTVGAITKQADGEGLAIDPFQRRDTQGSPVGILNDAVLR